MGILSEPQFFIGISWQNWYMCCKNLRP